MNIEQSDIPQIHYENTKEIESEGMELEENTENKAGYTAISCGRSGRDGYARFPTFRLVLTDGRTDGRTDRRTDGRTKALIELRVRN